MSEQINQRIRQAEVREAIAAIRRRNGEATGGPWTLHSTNTQYTSSRESFYLRRSGHSGQIVNLVATRADAESIVNARNDLAVLLAEYDDVSRRLAQLENAITWNTSCLNCANQLDVLYAATCRAEQAEQRAAALETDLIAARITTVWSVYDELGPWPDAVFARVDDAKEYAVKRMIDALPDAHDGREGHDGDRGGCETCQKARDEVRQRLRWRTSSGRSWELVAVEGGGVSLTGVTVSPDRLLWSADRPTPGGGR